MIHYPVVSRALLFPPAVLILVGLGLPIIGACGDLIGSCQILSESGVCSWPCCFWGARRAATWLGWHGANWPPRTSYVDGYRLRVGIYGLQKSATAKK